MFKRWRRRTRALLNFAFKKPIGIKDVRDRLAYQALWTSRFSAFLSLLAVILSALVAYVAISSLRLNAKVADQARRASDSQVSANRILAESAALQAQASVSAAKTSKDSLIASQRAWIGPTDGSLLSLNVGEPLKVRVNFSNTGREPAPTNSSLTPQMYSLEDWNSGLAGQDIENFKNECLASAMDDRTARITFPTSGFTSFIIGYDGTQSSLRDVQKLSVSPELQSGKQILAVRGCFIYKTIETVHRTAFCYFYQSKFTDIAHLNFCNGGQAAN